MMHSLRHDLDLNSPPPQICPSIHHSCRQDFLDRVKRNDTTRRECKKNGTAVPDLKRKPVGPRPAHIVRTKNNKPTLFEPIPYVSGEVTRIPLVTGERDSMWSKSIFLAMTQSNLSLRFINDILSRRNSSFKGSIDDGSRFEKEEILSCIALKS